jgi:hypothetical protein
MLSAFALTSFGEVIFLSKCVALPVAGRAYFGEK